VNAIQDSGELQSWSGVWHSHVNAPLGPLGSSSSQHRRTPELVLQKDHASFQTEGRRENETMVSAEEGGEHTRPNFLYRGTLLIRNHPPPTGGTSLITCGDFENACLFLKKMRNFSKNGCSFLKKIRNFSENGCLFLIYFRPLPLCDVVSDQK